MATHKFQSDQITECRFWLWCTVIVLLITFFFGLRFKGYSIENDARLLPHKCGLEFHGNGIAYTGDLGDGVKIFDKNFSMEIALSFSNANHGAFKSIVMLHDGDDGDQLLIGQWRNWIIIMNGDDYDHSRKTKRISIKIATDEDRDKAVFLTIVSTKEDTSLFLDGKLVRQITGFHLKVPQVPDTRLIIGNGIYGKRAWTGKIWGLSLYGRALSNEEIAGHIIHWRQDHDFGVRKDKPAILYLFKGLRGRVVKDYGTLGIDLEIPYILHGLKPDFFSLSPENFTNKNISSVDCLLNLLGFIPLGLTLFALFKTTGMTSKRAAISALCCCFLVTLCIEVAQAWIPSRSSDALDIFFNILGALFGIVLWKVIAIIFQRRRISLFD